MVALQQSKSTVSIATSVSQIPSLIRKYPIVIYQGDGTEEELKKIAGLFGGPLHNHVFTEIRDIRYDRKLALISLANSMKAHPPHTDGTFVNGNLKYFMLQSVAQDATGGEGIFWSVDHLLEQMPLEFQSLFSNNEFVFERLREDGVTRDSYRGPILTFNDNENPLFRWRFDVHVRPEIVSNGDNIKDQLVFQRAVACMCNYFATTPPIEILYDPGDIVICDNQRVLHGRRALRDRSIRYMRRAWLTYS